MTHCFIKHSSFERIGKNWKEKELESINKNSKNMAIEKLENTCLRDRDGNCYGYQYPTNKELMDKINEIIDYINNKEANNKPSQNEIEDDKLYLKGGF